MIAASLLVAGCSSPIAARLVAPARAPVTLDMLAIPVSSAENRAVSFTNKRSAYYYTQTHRNDHPEHAWFRGLNIAGRRVFNDYTVIVGGVALDPASARVVVRPDALIRTYPGGVTETLRLLDDRDVVAVEVSGDTTSIALRVSGDQVRAAGTERGLDWYVSSSGAGAPVDQIAVGRRGNQFLIAVAGSRQEAQQLFDQTASRLTVLMGARRERLERLVNGDRYLWTSDARLTEALRWITLTSDELITRQRGDGIYAGLPWFNEYWGRDSFISLTGTTLVSGHFAEARAILTSFAGFQDLDTASRFYGRLPNIVKPGSVDYHTTDGTPRWVIALRDYVDYSGDRSIIPTLYPNVTASIEGSLAHWTDSAGYLVHADNETWMDARREPDHASYSPRGTRANDIQALWHDQLRAGAGFALALGDTVRARRWTTAAERVRARFARDFVELGSGRIADRLDAANRPDFTLRPNLLFALGMIADERAAAQATRLAWEGLVYPWGVATLGQADPFFHPYHLAWEHYHKDEAYHNGTVWPWLNGIAMQRMIENGQTELAWQLFRDMSELALARGGVGGLPETMDAFPHPGETAPRLTGTFLQGWSNAEQLRVWYQYFLGIRPELSRGAVLLAPRIPSSLQMVDFTVPVGSGTIRGIVDNSGATKRFSYKVANLSTALTLDIAPYEVGHFSAVPGDSLVAELRVDGLHTRLLGTNGVVRQDVVLGISAARVARQAALDSVFTGTTFARPGPASSHPVMSQRYSRDQ